MMPNLEQVLDALYASEINASISWLWDGGIDVKIGDEINGFDAEGSVRTAAEAAAWLDAKAREIYPTSVYAGGAETRFECLNRGRCFRV
jgi:hypothetical protein